MFPWPPPFRSPSPSSHPWAFGSSRIQPEGSMELEPNMEIWRHNEAISLGYTWEYNNNITNSNSY
jgi:hypothetical protein